MKKINIGCAGWEYKDWVGPFYPKRLENRAHLQFYSKYFNLVELNSSFYNLPLDNYIMHWNDAVPDEFFYIIKVWKEITHDFNSPELLERIDLFFSRFRPLEDKIWGYLFQFPPWFKYSEDHLKKLINLIKEISSKKKLIIELRENSWYETEVLASIRKKENVVIATSYLKDLDPYFYLEQEHYYVRLIGDRQLSKFNRVQRNQHEIMEDLLEKINELNKNPNVYNIFIIVNNHFTGFAPETSNLLKKKLNLPYTSYSNQTNLMDFF